MPPSPRSWRPPTAVATTGLLLLNLTHHRSAPALPHPNGYGHQQQHQQNPPQPPYGSPASSSFRSGYRSSFPPGTNPDAIRSFEMADRDWSGYIDEMELQQALCSVSYQRFSTRTDRLLMFLFKNPNDPLRLGGPPKNSLLCGAASVSGGFDRDRSGKIDSTELRDALHSLGCVILPSVLQVLMSTYDDGSGRTCELNFDAFVECGMVVKGLTEKFKEKDPPHAGLATLGYDEFMCMILPFLVSYD